MSLNSTDCQQNNPLRPIVSLPGFPTYNLSKHLSNILKPLINSSPHSMSNANAFFFQKISKVEPDEIMKSFFDVVSFFTSIPLDTARQITKY